MPRFKKPSPIELARLVGHSPHALGFRGVLDVLANDQAMSTWDIPEHKVRPLLEETVRKGLLVRILGVTRAEKSWGRRGIYDGMAGGWIYTTPERAAELEQLESVRAKLEEETRRIAHRLERLLGIPDTTFFVSGEDRIAVTLDNRTAELLCEGIEALQDAAASAVKA